MQPNAENVQNLGNLKTYTGCENFHVQQEIHFKVQNYIPNEA